MKKMMLVASTGGHLAELLELENLFQQYDFHIITEKTPTTVPLVKQYPNRVDFVRYGNRHHWLQYLFAIPVNLVLVIKYFIKYSPDVVITTGAHTAIFPCLLAKLLGKKTIYIETFANLHSKTMSGRFLYHVVDDFIVQWDSMLKLYPKAKCLGWIY